MQTKEEILLKGEIVANHIGIDVQELDLHDLCNYHLPLLDVFEVMDIYSEHSRSQVQTLLDEVNRLNDIVEKQGKIINSLRDLE